MRSLLLTKFQLSVVTLFSIFHLDESNRAITSVEDKFESQLMAMYCVARKLRPLTD